MGFGPLDVAYWFTISSSPEMFVQGCAEQGLYDILYVNEMDFEISLAYIFISIIHFLISMSRDILA